MGTPNKSWSCEKSGKSSDSGFFGRSGRLADVRQSTPDLLRVVHKITCAKFGVSEPMILMEFLFIALPCHRNQAVRKAPALSSGLL